MKRPKDNREESLKSGPDTKEFKSLIAQFNNNFKFPWSQKEVKRKKEQHLEANKNVLGEQILNNNQCLKNQESFLKKSYGKLNLTASNIGTTKPSNVYTVYKNPWSYYNHKLNDKTRASSKG